MKPIPPNFDRFRYRLACIDALPQLALLGLISGILTALVITLFRELITLLALLFTGGVPEEAFHKLPWDMRAILPLGGSILLIIVGFISHKKYHRIGVVHVIERLDWHQGRLTIGNFLHQFFAGAIAIASGHSIGREGPAVHLGAASGSMLGQCMRLPNNSLRILVACGTAAAISAAFNTPVAGVIFALEVLLIEYTVAGFLPVMLASVSAATITQWMYGTDPAFIVPNIDVHLFRELPMVVLIGISMGLLGTVFCKMINLTSQSTHSFSPWVRLILAALITGGLSIPAPDIMGIGYDTVTQLLEGVQVPAFLFLVLGCKLIASAASVGLGVPGGLIGPSIFLGAVGGALTVSLASYLPGITNISTGFHVMVGMCAMLAAVLQAPLTALVQVVEMTQNPTLLFPALVAIVVASLTSSLLMDQHGVFEQVLESWGFDRLNNPVHKAFNRIGVRSLMDRSFVRLDRFQQPRDLSEKLGIQPEWVLIDDEKRPKALLPTIEISQLLNQPYAELLTSDIVNDKIDLLGIPALRYETFGIRGRASVYEAWQVMNQKQIDSLYVYDDDRRKEHKVIGVITQKSLERYYRVRG